MRVSKQVRCAKFRCKDVVHDGYLVPNLDLAPREVRIVLISESAPSDAADWYYAKGEPLFQATTVQAFQDAGARISSFRDVLGLGVYLTTAVKCRKQAYGIQTATVEECSRLLEKELALFPDVKAWLLMGDVAIKAVNFIARRGGEGRVVPAGSYMCDRQNFGPVDISQDAAAASVGVHRQCRFVPNPTPVSAAPITYYDTLAATQAAEDRATAAAQAQRDLAAAQALFDAQQADAAAAQAQAARDAQAQAAAAQAAAEEYRRIQKEIQDQATAVAARIAALAAQQSGREAAIQAATQVGMSQAQSQAIGDEYAKTASYGVAAQAAASEAINQASYQGALSAITQSATGTGGAAPKSGFDALLAGFDLKTMLIVGSALGVGLLVFGVPGQKKGAARRRRRGH